MNRIYIQPLETGFQPFQFLLSGDFNVEAQSEYSSFGELLPGGINDVITAVLGFQGIGGETGTGTLYIHSVIDMKRWTRTNPITITCTLKFYVKENVLTDVWYPTNLFMGMSILTRKSEGDETAFYTPGPNLSSLKVVSETLKGDKSANVSGAIYNVNNKGLNSIRNVEDFKFPYKTKLVSILIPGVIYLPAAFIEVATPTFSNHVVTLPEDDGREFPLWTNLELKITGITPATDDMLKDSTKIIIRNGEVITPENAQIASNTGTVSNVGSVLSVEKELTSVKE